MPIRFSALKPRVAAPLAGLAGLVLLAGCASLQSSDNFLGVITPYRVEVVQGNVVTKEQMALVKPGMGRAQVRDILGSPLLTDIFHADRWDYVFTIKRQGTEPQERRIVLLFDGEQLKSVQAPELPTEKEFAASITRTKDLPSGAPPVLELSEDQRKALPLPPRAEAAASAPQPTGPTRPYPPLEAAQ
jgi:outer membrane protein assembly factor BamE